MRDPHLKTKTLCNCESNDFDCQDCFPDEVVFGEEPIEVSDWSQKYKLAIYAVSGIVLSAMGFKIIRLLEIIAKCQQYN